MPSRTFTIKKKYTKEEYQFRYSSFFFFTKTQSHRASQPMRKPESLKIYGYLSRGTYRRVKKQHASPRMTEKPSATLRVPCRQCSHGSPQKTLSSSVCGCRQASKPSKSLSLKYKLKHSSVFSKLYKDAINRHEKSSCPQCCAVNKIIRLKISVYYKVGLSCRYNTNGTLVL